VESYLNFLGSKYTGLYNRRGRAFPDVSAQGAKYLITWQGMHVHGIPSSFHFFLVKKLSGSQRNLYIEGNKKLILFLDCAQSAARQPLHLHFLLSLLC
jgi:hypothetical protein